MQGGTDSVLEGTEAVLALSLTKGLSVKDWRGSAISHSSSWQWEPGSCASSVLARVASGVRSFLHVPAPSSSCGQK